MIKSTKASIVRLIPVPRSVSRWSRWSKFILVGKSWFFTIFMIYHDFHGFSWFSHRLGSMWQTCFTRSSEQVAEGETWAQLPPKHARECLRASEYSQQRPRAIPHRLEKFLITLRSNLCIYDPQALATVIAQLSIHLKKLIATCTLGLSKPPSMKRLTFFPSQKSSFLMIFWWFLMIFDVFGVFYDILINFADFCRTLWTLSTMLDVVSILIFVYATLWVRFPNPRLAKYCLSHS